MLELQPVYLLVTALGSRLAVASNLAVAACGRGSRYKVGEQKAELWCMATREHGNDRG